MRRWCVCQHVRVIALEAFGGHAHFQLASPSQVHSAALGRGKKKQPCRGERESWKISNKHSGCLRGLERPSKSAVTWEYGGTFEGLVRKTCPAVSSTCFQLRDFATPRQDAWVCIQMHRSASCGAKCTENTGQPRQSSGRHTNLQRRDRSCRQQHLLRAPRLAGTPAPCNCQETVAGSISFLKRAHTSRRE